MSFFNNSPFNLKNVSGIIPVLEYLAPEKGEGDYIGLTKDGRTVNWMRNTHAVLTPAFMILSGIMGSISGAVAGFILAINTRSRCMDLLFWSSPVIGMTAGITFGALPSALASSLVSSIIVPPVAGIANLVCKPYQA